LRPGSPSPLIRLARRLDWLDLELLKLLEEDGRISYSEAARRLGVSVQAVRRRVAKLLELGVVKIKACSEALEKAYILLPVDSGRIERVVEELKSNPHVVAVYRVAQPWGKRRLDRYNLLVELEAVSTIELEASRVLNLAEGNGAIFIVTRRLHEKSNIAWIIKKFQRQAYA